MMHQNCYFHSNSTFQASSLWNSTRGFSSSEEPVDVYDVRLFPETEQLISFFSGESCSVVY